MFNTLDYFSRKTDVLSKKLEEIKTNSAQTAFLVGIHCLLVKYHTKVVLQLLSALATFSHFINVPNYLHAHQSSTMNVGDAEILDDSDADSEDSEDSDEELDSDLESDLF